MKFLLLSLLLATQSVFGVVTTAQVYQLNNQFTYSLPHAIQLGTIVQSLEPTGSVQLARGVLQSQDTTITTAQILALNTTPITVVTAPGTGFVNIVDSVWATMTYNSATYSCNAAGLIVKYTNGSGQDVASTLTQGFCQSSASAMQSVRAAATALTPVANAALVLHAGAANPTTGDSAIKIRVFYRRVANPAF